MPPLRSWPARSPRARSGALNSWRNTAYECLALVLVLDQFPRNVFCGTPESFAYDPLASEVALASIARGGDHDLDPVEAVFLYLPLEHAEDMRLQEQSLSLFRALRDRAPPGFEAQFASFEQYAIAHYEVIERFGRFPHRNAVLGRQSSEEERLYLESGGSGF